MDSAEEIIARKCIATLLELPEAWKPCSEIPETAEAQGYHQVLISCGYCETEYQYTVRLLNGSDVTFRFISHGRPATMDGAGSAVPPDVEKLKSLNAHLPDNVDTNAPYTSRSLRVRPTIVGQLLREEFSGNSDEAAVAQFVTMMQDPPLYSVKDFRVVPEKIAGADKAGGEDATPSLTKGKKRGRKPAKPTRDENLILRILEAGMVKGPEKIAREAGVFDEFGEPDALLVKRLQSRLSAQKRRKQRKSSDDVA
ncbi:MAG: hypothetical protein ABGZ53_08745 [Fuerstiella sp.]